jgi:ubiquinone/menaquinone biosynthesis C-methylase UbiE
MEKLVEIITPLHKKTARDYLARMTDDKVHCMKVAKEFGKDFWDGDRRYGYGGYRYDGRQEALAKAFIEKFHLKDGCSILDVGCGKGFLLHEFKKLMPKSRIAGFDISRYAIENSKEEVRKQLFIHRAQDRYPFKDKEFDMVISITTLHNLLINELKDAVKEIERIGKEKYIAVESFRDDPELFNLECWALTCASFHTPEEWIWLYNEFGYTGWYEFIFFE